MGKCHGTDEQYPSETNIFNIAKLRIGMRNNNLSLELFMFCVLLVEYRVKENVSKESKTEHRVVINM